MTFKINSSEKHTCQGCQRTFRLHHGAYVNLDSPEPKFFCLKCLGLIHKGKEEAKFLQVAEDVREFSANVKRQEDREINEAMVRTLLDMFQGEGYLKIRDVTEQFKIRIKWEICEPRKVSDILTHMGFTGRLHKADGNYVYIPETILKKYADMLSKELRSLTS